MDDHAQYPDQETIRAAMRLAATPAGQKLMEKLRSSTDPAIQKAMLSASGGDLEAAKKAIQGALNSGDLEAIRRQMEGK